MSCLLAGGGLELTDLLDRSPSTLSAGEASLVISVEDITGKYEASEESVDPQSGKTIIRRVMNLDEVVKRIVATMRVREEAEGKEYGVIVLAEGLAEWKWASTAESVADADLVIATCGDVPTLEALAALDMLKEQGVKATFVNVVDLLKIQNASENDQAISDERFSEFFGTDKLNKMIAQARQGQ